MKLDDLLNAKPEPPQHCQFSVWLSTLKRDDVDAIYRAFDNENVTTRHIYRTLKGIGYPNGESSLRSHRRGECITCERNRTHVVDA